MAGFGCCTGKGSVDSDGKNFEVWQDVDKFMRQRGSGGKAFGSASPALQKVFGGAGDDLFEYESEWVANYENKVVPSRWGWQIESTISYTWQYTTKVIKGVGDQWADDSWVNFSCKKNPTSNVEVPCRIPVVQIISSAGKGTGVGTQGVMTFCKPDYYKIPMAVMRFWMCGPLGRNCRPDSWFNATHTLKVDHAVNHIFADPAQPCSAYFPTKAVAEAALDQPPSPWSSRPVDIALPNALATDILYDAMYPCLSDNPQNNVHLADGCGGRTQDKRIINAARRRYGSCDYMKRVEILGPGNIPMKDERTIEFPNLPKQPPYKGMKENAYLPRGPWRGSPFGVVPPTRIEVVMAGNCP